MPDDTPAQPRRLHLDPDGPLAQALAHHGLVEDPTAQAADVRDVRDVRGDASGDLVIEVRDPGPGIAQVLLHESDDGALTWHLPQEGPPSLRGPGASTYLVPRTLGGAWRAYVFPLLRAGATWVGERYAERFEQAWRPHRLRRLVPGEQPTGSGLTDEELRSLGPGRTLLLVHGTFSTAHATFDALGDPQLREILERYDGRVLVMDHPTISVSPADNAAWLVRRLAEADVQLELDVVAHSRGGLVGRVLAEQPGLAGVVASADGRVRIERLVMVATPNAGTALADVDHLGQLLDRLTSLLHLFPRTGAVEVLDLVVAVVKQLAAGVVEGLDGLAAMDPDSDLLAALNVATRPGVASRYRVVASDFEPRPGSPLLRVVQDAGADLVFGDRANDLVVPTRGSYDVGVNLGLFPVEDRLVLDADEGVDHLGYWSHPRFAEQLLAWLPRE